MTMKRLITIIFATLTLTGAMAQNNNSNKQNRGGKSMSATEMTSYLTKELNLSSDQKEKVQKLNEQYSDLFKGSQGKGGGKGNGPQMNGNESSQKPDGAQGGQGKKNNNTDSQTGASDSRRMPPSGDFNNNNKNSNSKSSSSDNDKQWSSYNKSMKKILSSKQYKTYESLMNKSSK